MPKRMLIDASHPEETRVVVIDGNRVEEFDFEAASKRPLKGNIYLAKVTRVEPSLQAAFVEYGGNRQGFLAFSEIHPDYYQIPVADRMAILQAQTERLMAEEDVESIDTHNEDHQSSPEEEAHEHAADTDEEQGDSGDDQQGDPDKNSFDHEDLPGSESATGDEPVASVNRAAHDEPHKANPSEAVRTAPEQTISPEPSDLPAEPVVASEAADTVESTSTSVEGPGEPGLVGANVQAESTGAPQAWQRRDARGHDRPRSRRRQYKIQEVIKRRQVMLVQVVKEERGNKGASLTTFLSLAGRYCVLMPNTPRGGGISRKITNAADRKRLKSAAQSLDLPEGMGLIIRTAGANRTKTEIKRDYEYLLRLWDTVRELTLQSNAPALVYEEGSLIKRAIRDLYSKEISEVLVDGEGGYREAKEFMRMLMPSHAKNVKLYREPLPLFQRLQVESQLDAMFSPIVNLRSGGYIVINQAEALVAIDVNSGRATREHSIEETALKTNLEAADEIARQLRLRDLAGLIVIDFIDMEDTKNDRNVEKRLHNAVRNDRARIQIGRISQFGLLELSRQRLRAGVVAGSTITCPHCNGQGIVRSTESAALRLLRALDEEGQRQSSVNLTVRTPSEVAIYTLNQKRREVARIEEAYDVAILFEPQTNMVSGSFEIQRTGMRVPAARPKISAISVEGGFRETEQPEAEPDVTIVEPPESPAAAESTVLPESGAADPKGRKRRRRRRGGRGRNGRALPGETELRASENAAENSEPGVSTQPAPEEHRLTPEIEIQAWQENEAITSTTGTGSAADQAERRRRRRRRGRRGRRFESEMPAGGHITSAEEPFNADLALADMAPPGTTTESLPPETPFSAGPASEAQDVMANMPSSPVWSLVETPVTRLEVMSGAEAVPPLPKHEAGTVTVEISEAAAEPPQAVAEDIQNATENGTREARRGWWQRRFKG